MAPHGVGLTENEFLDWLRPKLDVLRTQTNVSLEYLIPRDHPVDPSINESLVLRQSVDYLLSAGVGIVPLIQAALVKFAVVSQPWSAQLVSRKESPPLNDMPSTHNLEPF